MVERSRVSRPATQASHSPSDTAADLGALAVEWIALTPVTSHGWRVTDARRSEGDPLRLLAFIELRGSVFEVMQLGVGFEWHEFDLLLEAIEFIVHTSAAVVQARQGGELAWVR